MTSYEPVIGLEIHVQLATRTKMFCSCELAFGDPPNIHTCPVCLGHPGSLPVPNKRAIELAIGVALALGCEIAPRSIFHRKNYFYPDLPKGYQISQYDIPLAAGGRLGEVRIHRAHLEEDAAKLSHAGESGRIHGSAASMVDFNRGGTPLLEIVTEPDIRSASQAREWLTLLRETIRQIGASDVNMEEGSLRCDANVSIRPAGSEELGVKTELKNMNSFRFLEHGVDAEIARQIELLEGGGKVTLETLHFDPRTGSLTPLRSKEEAHDYRYFPEPDLVPLEPSEEMIAAAREALPELPAERQARYEAELGLTGEQAAQLAFDVSLASFLEQAVSAGDTPAAEIAKWLVSDVVGALREREIGDPAESRLEPAALAQLVAMVAAKQVSRDAGREVLGRLIEGGGDPAQVVEAEGLGSVSDEGELAEIVKRAIEAEPGAAAKVAEGNTKAVGPLVGFVMRETRGRADGGEVTRLIRERLAGQG